MIIGLPSVVMKSTILLTGLLILSCGTALAKQILLDVGSKSDRPDLVEGITYIYENFASVKGTSQNFRYSRHRFGRDFSYVLPVKPGKYQVIAQLAENYQMACSLRFRIFDMFAFDGALDKKSGVYFEKIDVFRTVGCITAYSLKFSPISVGKSGRLKIRFIARSNNAMISALIISTIPAPNSTSPTLPLTPPKAPTLPLTPPKAPTLPPTPPKAPTLPPTPPKAPTLPPTPPKAPIPSPNVTQTKDRVMINVGALKDTPIPGTKTTFTTSAVKGTTSAHSSMYRTARVGNKFTYPFKLKPGAYDIVLGFIETNGVLNCKESGKRVFNVYINNLLQLEGYDIFAKAGCFKGIEEKFTLSVSAILTEPLLIRFESVVGQATVSFISIKPALASCIPESVGGELSSDHAAHAVPGTYPPQLSAHSPKTYIDTVGDGFVSILIDGGGSHTHFSDSKNGVLGRITKYTWSYAETGKVLSNRPSFVHSFPLGTTRLKLSVIDNSCSTDEAETTVTVTGAVKPGQYCYYYSSLKEMPAAGTLLDNPRPSFSAASPTLDLKFPSFKFSDTLFAARCFFFLEVDVDGANLVGIRTSGTGFARIYKGADLIVDSQETSWAKTELPVGLTRFEVTYLRTTLKVPPRLTFLVDGKVPALNKISYDLKTVVPIISSVTPSRGNILGGNQIKVIGYGLYQPLTVTIGGKAVSVLPYGATDKQFFVRAPSSQKVGVVKIIATTSSDLSSNPINYAYGSTCDSVGFTSTELGKPNGKSVNFLKLATCITIGHDQRLYIGLLGGSVHVVGYNRQSMQTTSHCYSRKLIDPQFSRYGKPSPRDILGITTDPRDAVIRPYITVNTIRFLSRIDSNNPAAWRNAAVERLKPGKNANDPNVCLVYDKKIVSGLPLSNHDHAVSALVFTNDGDLLIGVGGSTNMGLPGYRLGNFWESPLSAALVIARLSKPNFNGKITYSAERPDLAKQLSGDVEVYAGGLRNPFAMTMDALGRLFVTDQACNCDFGNVATSCKDYNSARANKLTYASPDWPGATSVAGETCATKSATRPDKLVLIEKGKTYGHANIQRGGDECSWIDPFTEKTALGKPAPASYKSHVSLVMSPTTGIGVYAGMHFCGALRGDVITTAYEGRPTFRIGVKNGRRTSGPDQLIGTGGIAFAENAHGELIVVRHNVLKLMMIRPVVRRKVGLYVSGLSPIRSRKKGGLPLTIGGLNFGTAPSVTVGGAPCVVVRRSATEIACTLPAHSGGTKSVTVSTTSGDSQTVPNAILYMNV